MKTVWMTRGGKGPKPRRRSSNIENAWKGKGGRLGTGTKYNNLVTWKHGSPYNTRGINLKGARKMLAGMSKTKRKK